MHKPSPAQCQQLLEMARQARSLSYAPYSHFAVGSAVLTEQGVQMCAANIENASFSLTVCAERNVLFGAYLARAGNVIAMAVSVGKGSITRPCGACLQVMAELAPKLWLILDNGSDGYDLMTLAELLPQPFTFPPR